MHKRENNKLLFLNNNYLHDDIQSNYFYNACFNCSQLEMIHNLLISRPFPHINYNYRICFVQLYPNGFRAMIFDQDTFLNITLAFTL